MKKNYIIIIFFLLFAEVVHSQNLSGCVKDKNNNPIPYANISLFMKSDSNYFDGSITDNNGNFKLKIPKVNDFLLSISCLNYEDTTIHAYTGNNESLTLPDIILNTNVYELNEIVINQKYPTFKLSEEGLVVDVANSMLRKEVKITDVLRKIPGMIFYNGELSTFAQGTPVIYINEKKTHSYDEVELLTVTDIQKVTLLTNPSVEYDTNGAPVLIITTKKKDKGIMFQIISDFEQGRRLSHNNGIHLNYNKDKLNLYGSFQFSNDKVRFSENAYTSIQTDTLWNYESDNHISKDVKKSLFQVGMDYQISSKHIINFQYNGTIKKDNSQTKGLNSILSNHEEYLYFNADNYNRKNIDMHHLSGTYKYQLKDKITFYYYVDYLKHNNKQNQEIVETNILDNFIHSTTINNTSDFDIFVMNGAVKYLFNKNITLTCGSDLNWIERNNTLKGENNIISEISTKTKEEKKALFISLLLSKANFSSKIGLKYEELKSKMNDYWQSNNNIDTLYRNFLPSLNINYTVKNINQSLNYSVSVIRPGFNMLNTNVYYTSYFSYLIGNPNIKSTVWQYADYNLNYKFLYLSLIYADAKDYAGYNYYEDPTQPSVVVTSYTNYNRYRRMAVTINLQHQYKIWETYANFYYLKPFFQMNYMGKSINYNRSGYNFNWNNNILLPKDFYFNIEYLYTSRNNYLMFELNATHVVNLSLQKTFCNNKLNVSIFGKNIFNGDKTNPKAFMNTISYYQKERPDNQKFGISIIYKFNNYKKNHSNDNSIQEVLERIM